MAGIKPEDVDRARKREAYIASELYRALKNSLRYIGKHRSGWVLKDVIPEYPVGDKKADLVVVGALGRHLSPLLVVEIKQRVFTRIGPSYVSAAKQAMSYARQLDSKYFAVYDGWILLLFSTIYPYLLGAYHIPVDKLDESLAKDLLEGLLDLSYSRKRDMLDRLPRFSDVDFLRRKVLPFLARALAETRVRELKDVGIEASEDEEREKLLKEWEEITRVSAAAL